MFNKMYSVRHTAAKAVMTAVFVFFVFANSANSVGNDTIKCTNLDALYNSLPEMEEGQLALDRLSKEMQSSLKKKYDEYTRLMQELQKAGHNISDDEKQKRLQEIQEVAREIEASQVESQRKYANKRAEIKLSLIKIIQPAIDSYCRSLGIKIMIGLESSMLGEFPNMKCVYVDPTYEATNPVLSILKKLRAQKSKNDKKKK